MVVLRPQWFATQLAAVVTANPERRELLPGGILQHSTEAMSAVFDEIPQEWLPSLLDVLHQLEIAIPMMAEDGRPLRQSMIPAMLLNSAPPELHWELPLASGVKFAAMT